MIKHRLVLATLIAIAFVFTTVTAQSGRVRGREQRSKGDDEKGAVRLRAEEVLLPLSARADTGGFIEKLSPSDIIVAEDEKRQHITAVSRTPANILLILDASGEEVAVKNVNKHRELALKIVASLGSEDRAAVVTYSDTANIISDWTTNKDELRQSINARFKPGLKSSLYESLIFAAEEVLPKAEGRRSVVLITDGVNSFYKHTFSEALKAIHRARATVYVISQGQIILDDIKPRAYNALSWYEKLDPQQNKRIQRLRHYAGKIREGKAVMDRLVEETGGMVWIPASDDEFLKADDSVVEEIGTEFVVSYVSERREGDEEFHRVNVYSVSTHIRVRSRSGVYSNLPPAKVRDSALPDSKN